MKPREQFQRAINFQKPTARLPMVEWAGWWDKTHHRWQKDGLPTHLRGEDLVGYFGLDHLHCIHGGPGYANMNAPTEKGYDEIRHYLFTDERIVAAQEQARQLSDAHNRGEVIVRMWLDGFFWFPRKLLGIETHLYAFYDQPALMHRMNQDLADFGLRLMEAVFPILTPDMVGFAEDMSYNHGPMLSHSQFKEFLLPYYNQLIPYIKTHTTCWVDTDGDVTQMIPWLLDAGVQGIYPLERQAGVDIAEIRKKHPHLLMLGAFDKMVMSKDETAIRGEFERLLPVMKGGGFIVSMDHQTPPETPLGNYWAYLKLYEEFCARAWVG